MLPHRRYLALFAFLLAAVTSAWAAPLPRPLPSRHAEARLIAGNPMGNALSAGLEIVLDPGFKTYWRMPGESGLPPSFDWSGSRNVAGVTVGWPAPHRIEDAGGVAYGFEDRVVLPLTVQPADPALPVTLALRLDYGVCHDLCIPEHADLARTLTASPPADEAARVSAAFGAIPVAQPLGATGALAILAVERTGPDRLGVTVRAHPAAPVSLFVEAPDPWFLLADAAPAPITDKAPPDSALARFDVRVLQRGADNAGPLSITLTLVGGGAVETRLTLDASLLAR
jgi:DsbC/DsbD-like thiol-disulfide interchange protein